MNHTQYEIGVATVDITPPVGTPLAGNFRDDYASRGVHTPLTARALAVRSGGAAVALVAADLLTVPETMVALARRQIEAACGLRPEQVLISATHTHSGPAAELVAGPPAPAAVIEKITAGIAAACIQAHQALRSSGLWRGATQTDHETLFFNRRLRLKDGRTVMNWTRPPRDAIDAAWGPTDPEMGLLLAGADPEYPTFFGVNAALHAAVLAGDNWLINADWPGYYYQAVQRIFGSDATAMYFQGAQGNINHLDAFDPTQGRGFKEAQRIGSTIALAAAAARRELRSVSGPVAWSSRQVALPPRVITPAEIARAEQVVAESAASGEAPRGQTDGLPELLFARAQLELAPRTEPYATEIQALRIGDLAVVGLPGEFFVEFGLEIKRRSPAAQTFVVGLANGSLGYVPTAAAFAQGGYEPTSWHYSKLAPQAGPLCVAAALEQLQTLFGS